MKMNTSSLSAILALSLGSLLGIANSAYHNTGNALAGTLAARKLIAPTSDFTKPETGESRPGGAATSRKSNANRNAFSHSSGNIGFEGQFKFKIGNGIFRKLWVSAPASTRSSDGVGPLYNARSCQRCHLKDGRGHPPHANWPKDNAISMFLRLSIPPQSTAQNKQIAEHRANVIPAPIYGGQLQDLAIQGFDGEGRMHIDYTPVTVTLAGGETVTLRKPTYTITDFAYGKPHPDLMMSPRIAPQMIGLGLLEAIPESIILQYADAEDADNNGISGRPNRVWSTIAGKVSLGRFGWKAGMPGVAEQSAAAFAGDIGISSPLHPAAASGDCTTAQRRCLEAPNGNSQKSGNLEVGKKLFDLTVFYSQNLAVPRRRNASAPQVLKGKELFYGIGCINCHRPKFITRAAAPRNKHLSNQLIWPYTDMLLHDMGLGLADNRPEGVANGSEWRTAPLWGIGLTKTVNGHTFHLHDGRARNITEAILWHGGEAKPARDDFVAMDKADRERLVTFVKSL